MTVRLSPADPRYAALWDASPDRTPFAHPAALAAYADAFGLAPAVLAVEDEGALLAAVPVFEKRRGPFVAASLPPLCPVLAPLLAAPLGEADTHARRSPLDRLLAGLGDAVDQATLALGPGDLRPYAWAGWALTPRSTYRLDLGDGPAAGFSSNVRRTVRRDADAFVVSDDGDPGEAVRLMAEGYARGDAELGIDLGAATGLAQAFVTSGLARTFAATRDGTTEAAIVVASDGRTAYYWIAGSTPGPAMTVLVADVLARLAAEGVAAFDFCGANTPSIAEFKRRFGAQLAPAPIARLVASPVLRIAGRLRP
ncbi:GNAT family N-acetyltransferase [Rubrivirga sp. IMCC43871]|uniref:GNAT family N-acetyltransferase n=1 Tax=Rubrivirga sp. IMCC43871 TaxID=3391575 RepID=UPI00398FBA38